MNIVGPPLGRVADWKAPEKDVFSKGSESFDRVLEQKNSDTKNLERNAVKPFAHEKAPEKKDALESKRQDSSVKGSEARTERKPDKKTEQKTEDKSEKSDSKEKTEKVATKEVGKSQGKKATGAREKAIQKFMDSFESEFSVPPTRIVAAMAQLSEQKLAKAPEQTVDDVVGSLGLSDEDSMKAKALYGNLVNELSEIDRRSSFNPSRDQMIGADMVKERFTTNIERQGTLRSNLDKLNDKFWMKGVGASSNSISISDGVNGIGLSQQDANAWAATSDPNSMLAQQFGLLAGQNNFQDSVPGLRMPMQSGNGQQLDAAANSTDDDADVVTMPLADAENLVKVGLLSKNEVWGVTSDPSVVEVPRQKMLMLKEALENSITADQSNMSSKDLEMNQRMAAMLKLNPNQVSVQGNQMQNLRSLNKTDDTISQMMAQKLNGQSANQTLLRAQQKDSQNSDSSADSNAQAKGDLLPSMAGGLGLQGLGNEKDFAAMLQGQAKPVAMSPADHEANIKELMAQASVLVKKGGGEMRVKMSPEGMGDIHLKISLNEGRVQVQMQAETTEAKKAIESGLADLKSSLAAQKLAVDNVKVDVVHRSSTDNQTNPNSNPNSNLNGDAQREKLSQFWNQFRDNFGNGPKRDSFMEMAAAKSYTVRRGDPLQPIEEAQSRSVRSDGRGQSVDYVA